MQNREITNVRTRERIVFRVTSSESNGELLEMDDFWQNAEHSTPEHSHPGMEERWEVLSGLVEFEIGGVNLIAGPGDVVVAPPGVPHSAHNSGGTEVHLRIQMRPALKWAEFVAEMFALAAESDDRQALISDLLAKYPDEISA